MEQERSLPSSQKHTTCPSPNPDEFSLQYYTYFISDVLLFCAAMSLKLV
jgi:hypothetical protein